MRGSIVEKGKGKWLVRVWVGRDQQGRQQFHNKVIHGSRGDAETYAAERISERTQHRLIKSAKITLGEHLAYWLEDVARLRLRPSSHRSYVEYVERYVPDSLRSRRLQSVVTEDLEDLYRTLQRERGLAPRTIRYLHAILRSALRHAKVKRRLLAVDPTDNVELPPNRDQEIKAMTLADCRKLIAVLREDDRCGLLLELMLVLGLRPSEAIGLRIEDVDLDAATLRVAQRIVHLRGKSAQGSRVEVGSPKSRRSRRTLVLPSYLIPALREQRRRVQSQMSRHRAEELGLLFPTSAGTAMRVRNLGARHFKPALVRAGLPRSVRLYDLRHCHATILAAAGIPLRVVADQLGHSNPYVTVTTYQHVTSDTVGAVAEVFDRLMGQT